MISVPPRPVRSAGIPGAAIGVLLLLAPATAIGQGDVSGELRRWHPITVTFEGPRADESGAVNPFTDYRLDVLFRHEDSGETIRVPGYFAADGNAGETGATAGSKWRAHLTPARTGTWSYEASFRTGPGIALTMSPLAGDPASFDGASGSFAVQETNKAAPDFRGRGVLRYVDAHYLRFDNGEWFLKAGADSPETLLAYVDFDGTRALLESGVERSGEAITTGLHRYDAHVGDWRAGDPTWRDGKGKGLIGALNYLASEGMNAFSFLTMNVEGDGQNVWPWVDPTDPLRFDVSKLAQWEEVFSHADRLGLFLHFKTQETENDLLLDGGDLGPERKLYYRELIARFGHHPALNWNLGEENDIWEELDDPSQTRVKAYASWITALDPYDHPVVIHTFPTQQVEVYVPLLGRGTDLAGISLQTHAENVHEDTRMWVRASSAAGKPWVVSNDEQGPASTGVKPDGPDSNQDEIRRDVLWGNLMAGGAGVEYYFGYRFPHNDLNAQDFRSRDRMWDYTRYALEFFRNHLPFTEMRSANGLAAGEAYVFADPGRTYAVYVPESREVQLNLRAGAGEFSVRWFDPRSGGALQTGTVQAVAGGETVSIGAPPTMDGGDWVALVQKR